MTYLWRGSVSSRRLMGLVALALTPFATGAWWFGSDTNTTSGQSSPYMVYVGRISTETTCNSSYNNFQGAENAGVSISEIYAYGDLGGPGTLRGNSAYAYGQQQADELKACYASVPNGGLTMFADIESGNPGWTACNTTCYSNDHSANSLWQANVNVISGFYAEMAVDMPNVSPGIYTSRGFFDSYTPFQNWPANSFVWWATSQCPGYITQPSSLMSPSYYESDLVNWHNLNEGSPAQCLGGGQGLSMWQDYISTADYDLTPQQNGTVCGPVYCGGYFTTGWGDGTI